MQGQRAWRRCGGIGRCGARRPPDAGEAAGLQDSESPAPHPAKRKMEIPTFNGSIAVERGSGFGGLFFRGVGLVYHILVLLITENLREVLLCRLSSLG